MKSDIDYDELDPGIRELVRKLRKNGFNTTDSGDGKHKFKEGNEHLKCCALDFPNVMIEVDKENAFKETDRLARLLKRWGIKLKSEHICLIYSPTDRYTHIQLGWISDATLRRAEKRKEASK